jgi:GNAT superfamily N-acetyltransferase
MTTVVTPFSDALYEPLGELLDAVYPGYPGQLTDLRHEDATRAAHCKCARWLVLDGDRAVACAEYKQFAGRYHPRRFTVDVLVRPELEGSGLGGELYEHLLSELVPHAPETLQAFVRDDRPRAVRFAQARGFVEHQREIESHLDLIGYEPAVAAEREARLAERGIVLRSLAELADAPDRDAKFHALYWELVADVPAPHPPTQVPLDAWRERYFANPLLRVDGAFVAIDGNEYVGYSNLYDGEDGEIIYTGLTGVRRAHRGRGIAQALKHRGLAWAKAEGRRTVMTWNERANADILAINRKVGFVSKWAWIDFVKTLAAGEAADAGGAS